MTVDAIERMLNNLDELHSCPAVVQRILSLTADDDYELPTVASCLAHDPALAAAILRLVNSSLYGLHRKISGLDQAAMYLGRRSLRLAVLNFGLVDRFLTATPAQMFQQYWRHALTTASAARLLIAQMGSDREAEDDAFSAGLLADLGSLILAQSDPQRYIPLYVGCPHHCELADAETAAFGFDHAALGAQLMVRWNIPDQLCEVIEGHEESSLGGSMLQQALYAASLLADAVWSGNSPRMPELRELATEGFGMDTDQLISLALACKDAFQDAQSMFQMRLAGEMDIDGLRREARRQFTEAAFDAAILLDSVDSIVTDHVTIPEEA